jgi:NADPH:quinone reductase
MFLSNELDCQSRGGATMRPNFMKAIRVESFGGPEVLRTVDVNEVHPGEGEVVVRIYAAGVNPVETYIRSGTYAKLPGLPYTPGSDGAGVVDRVGKGVEGWEGGMRVYVTGSKTGTYAERAICTPDQLHPLPESMSFAQGAAIGLPYTTAHFALFHRAKAEAGETVLVHGASGGVGHAAVQLARAAGLNVFGTAGSSPGRVALAAQGVQAVFDHGKGGYMEEVLAATGGRGVDVILEMLANVNLGHDLTVLSPGGRVAVIGSRGFVEINPRDAMSRNADILGVMLGGARPEVLRQIHHEIGRGLSDGSLLPVIARELPLAEAPEAHRAMMAPGAMGKIVLVT